MRPTRLGCAICEWIQQSSGGRHFGSAAGTRKLRGLAQAKEEYEKHQRLGLRPDHRPTESQNPRAGFRLPQALAGSRHGPIATASAWRACSWRTRPCAAIRIFACNCASEAERCRNSICPCPRRLGNSRKTKPEIVAEIDRLLDHHTEGEIARALNQRDWRSSGGNLFTLRMIHFLRYSYGLKNSLCPPSGAGPY